ncbi:hypothetical protein B484DRAFT_470301, partial [Ochromonadaceae sp. CCMP2298]
LPAVTDPLGRGVQSPNKSKPQNGLGGGTTAAGRLPAIEQTNQSMVSSSSRATPHSAAAAGGYEMANKESGSPVAALKTVEERSTAASGCERAETGAEAGPAERDFETGAEGSTSNASTMLAVGLSAGPGDPSQAPGPSKTYPLRFPLVQDRQAGQSTCASSLTEGSAKQATSTRVNAHAIFGETPMPADNLDGSPTGEFQSISQTAVIRRKMSNPYQLQEPPLSTAMLIVTQKI